jgi:colicin import membrane protein
MLREFWEGTKALSLAVLVHLLAAALIVLGTLNWRPFKPPQITGMTIEAVIVDTQALKDRQAAERKSAEDAQRREQQRDQRQRELAAQREREAAEKVERERKAAEEVERKRQADLRLEKLREQQDKERAEQLAKQQAELEAVRKQREEAERLRKQEQDKLKQIEAQKQREALQQQQAEAEAAMQAQMEAEEREFRAGELATLSDSYYAAIQAQVTSNWLRPPTAQSGLRCTLSIVQIPGGEVISASIRGQCNADEATRRSLVAAVERAGTLPYRGFEDVFEREIDFVFTFNDE